MCAGKKNTDTQILRIDGIAGICGSFFLFCLCLPTAFSL
jgi:hypothetical protein